MSESNEDELPERESEDSTVSPSDSKKEREHVFPPVKITGLEPALKHFLTKPGEGFAPEQDDYIELLKEREGDVILEQD